MVVLGPPGDGRESFEHTAEPGGRDVLTGLARQNKSTQHKLIHVHFVINYTRKCSLVTALNYASAEGADVRLLDCVEAYSTACLRW